MRAVTENHKMDLRSTLRTHTHVSHARTQFGISMVTRRFAVPNAACIASSHESR